MDILSNLPAIILLTLIVGFLVFTGFRVGLPFLVRRIAGLIFVLFSASFITFALGAISPINAVDIQLGDKYTPQKAAILHHFYGLDEPFFQRYWDYVTKLMRFDLGDSWLQRGRSVWSILSTQLPASLLLGLSAAGLAVLVGVSAGMLAALRSNTRYDTAVQGAALFFFALPTFVLFPIFAIAMTFLYDRDLPHLPVTATEFGFAHPEQMIAPILLFALVQTAFYVRITRTSTLEVLRQDYVRTAKAKGLSSREVVWRHTFRNAMIPLLTALGPALAIIVNGAFITETIFNIQGIGTTTLASISQNNTPVVQGTVMLLAVSVALMNLVTDVLYGVVDPRIKTA
jgi:ABC-type dipeptide/oligopeptide/nickel transport system permease component